MTKKARTCVTISKVGRICRERDLKDCLSRSVINYKANFDVARNKTLITSQLGYYTESSDAMRSHIF